MAELIGRERELARLRTLLADGGRLMLRGPRGVGVSALLDAAVALAGDRRVLRVTGAPSESAFASAGLHQLLRPLRRKEAFPPDPADVAALVGSAFVVIDDWPWVDAESAAALAALPGPLLLGGHAAGPPGIEELRVASLSPDASARLLPAGLSPHLRARILREAVGRPLALLELPQAYAGADDGKLLGSWAPLTPALEEAFGCERVAPAILIAALDDGGNVPDILAATARLTGTEPDRAAFAGDVVEIVGECVRFAHPLTRAAVRHAADPAARRAGHEAFAAVVAATDPDRATWHRVVAAQGLDPALATAIEAVARRTRDSERAAAALRRAAILTPPGRDRSRRFAAAAELVYEIGAIDAAGRLLDQAIPEQLDAAGRARVALLRARGTETLLAAETPELAPRLRWRAATELAATGGDGSAIARGRGASGATERGAERPVAIALAGFAALVDGDVPRAAALLDRAAGELRAEHRRTLLGQVLALSAWARFGISEFERAQADAEEAVSLCVQPLWAAVGVAALAATAAVRGDEEATERHAAAAERVALPRGGAYVLALVQHARGALALSAGRPAEAYAHLRRTFAPTDPAYALVPFTTARADLAEAATSDEERAFVAAFDDPYVRFVLAAEDAILPSELTPFLRARALLVHGMRLRRSRRMADSREPLRAAASRFTRLGAHAWAERAQRELAATAETTHRTGVDRLTPQELEIARMAARGLTNPAIAADLAVSPRTVSHHLAKIFPKLEVSSRAGIGSALERHGY